jgi:transcription initiation factor TFIID TATA-box-binding protein
MLNVVNVVITADLGIPPDLADIAIKLNVPYNPKKFNGVVYRTDLPRSTTIFLKNGKVVCNLKKIEDIKKWQPVFENILKIVDIEHAGIEIEVENIVTTADLGRPLDLTHLTVRLGLENVEYHPESFVGLVYRVPEYNATLMIFRTGKVNILGTKKPGDAEQAFNKLRNIIKND